MVMLHGDRVAVLMMMFLMDAGFSGCNGRGNADRAAADQSKRAQNHQKPSRQLPHDENLSCLAKPNNRFCREVDNNSTVLPLGVQGAAPDPRRELRQPYTTQSERVADH